MDTLGELLRHTTYGISHAVLRLSFSAAEHDHSDEQGHQQYAVHGSLLDTPCQPLIHAAPSGILRTNRTRFWSNFALHASEQK